MRADTPRMPRQEIIDLSDLLVTPKQVRFEPDGELYTLPGDVPAELYLQINQLAGADGNLDPAALKALADEILRLLQVHNPALKSLPCSLTQMIAVFPRVYGSGNPPKTPRPRRASSGQPRTTKKTAAKSPTRSG